jgi:hypothetical protein
MLNIPVRFEDLLKAINQLSDEQKYILRAHLIASIAKSEKNDDQRIPDLFPGSIWMSDDFDDPLPDEFWLGEE